MRLSTLVWIFLLSVVLYSIVSVDCRKSTRNSEEIEQEATISERKNKVKSKKPNKYSAEQNSEESLAPKLKANEKLKKKRIESNVDYSKPDIESKKLKKFNKNKNQIEDKSSVDESLEEIPKIRNKKINNEKTAKKTQKNWKQTAETSSEVYEKPINKPRKKRAVLADGSDESPEDLGAEIFPKKKLRKQKTKPTEEIISEKNPSIAKKKKKQIELKNTQEEDDEVNPENDEETSDISENVVEDSDSGFCSGKASVIDGCTEIEALDNTEEEEEEEEEEVVVPKKIKYSTKFAHEKLSKKERNRETESILKLHRKAEMNQKSAKNMKKSNRFQEDDDESSEEISPRRRPALFEDEEI